MGWHAMIWQFKNRWQATKVGVCPFCSAQSQGDSLLYTEVGSNASWRPTIFTDLAAWAEAVLPQDDLCPLLGLPGFAIDTLKMCSMHNVNLGIAQICNGSSLVTLVLGGFYGNPNDSIAVNFRRAYRHFQAWRKSKRVNITQGVWKYGYVIKANGLVCMTHKAFNGRVLAHYFADVLAEALTSAEFPSDSTLRFAAACMAHLAKFFYLLEVSGRYLTEARAEEIYQTGLAFMRCHLQLTSMAMQSLRHLPSGQALFLWTLRPKLHYLEHQLIDLRRTRLNLRHHHCYTDEDGMRWLKQISRKVKRKGFEHAVLRISRLRLSLAPLKARSLNESARKRNK
ncbi:Uncharacterized protein SCF082_LOCUS25828 [Durusdinium trenchii]|uniref:Uncharacterized protein n=1 Tax=Durusdinium trenchii TaxID=1381693 RepID=A0ABP0M4Q5_9DINO